MIIFLLLCATSCSYFETLEVKQELLGDWVYETSEIQVYKDNLLRMDTTVVHTGAEVFSTGGQILHYPNYIEGNRFMIEKFYGRTILLPTKFEGEVNGLVLDKVSFSSPYLKLMQSVTLSVRFVLKGDKLEIFLYTLEHDIRVKITAKRK